VLLKQSGGRLDDVAAATLDVWDSRFAVLGDQLGHARAVLVERLAPFVAEAYDQLAEAPVHVEMRYGPPWRDQGLAAALAAARAEDLRRGASTVGPQRDDVELTLAGMAARTHASQGEQRSLALSLRLAAHRLLADRLASTPVLLLDDVLSELDPHRAAALLHHLPAGQVVLTTAGPLPAAASPDDVVTIENGAVLL
jgi:DNA replication and repair protein RecF